MERRTYQALVTDPVKVQALTSVTVDEFAELIGPFETAFQDRMAAWTLEGKPRQNRRYVPYTNSPLPTAEDRLLFILSYLKENPTQTYHGYLYQLPQGKVNQWIHTLFPVLRTALRTLGDAPKRDFAAVMRQLDDRLTDPPPVPAPATDPALEPNPAPPLFATMGPNAPSRAPTLHLNKGATIAARKSSTRSRTSSS